MRLCACLRFVVHLSNGYSSVFVVRPSSTPLVSRSHHRRHQPQSPTNNHTEKTPSFGLPVDLVAGKKDAKTAAANGAKGAAKGGKQKGKAAGLKALEVAQQSTASLGRCVRASVVCGVVWTEPSRSPSGHHHPSHKPYPPPPQKQQLYIPPSTASTPSSRGSPPRRRPRPRRASRRWRTPGRWARRARRCRASSKRCCAPRGRAPGAAGGT